MRELAVVDAAVQLFVEQTKVFIGAAQDPRFAVTGDLQRHEGTIAGFLYR